MHARTPHPMEIGAHLPPLLSLLPHLQHVECERLCQTAANMPWQPAIRWPARSVRPIHTAAPRRAADVDGQGQRATSRGVSGRRPSVVASPAPASALTRRRLDGSAAPAACRPRSCAPAPRTSRAGARLEQRRPARAGLVKGARGSTVDPCKMPASRAELRRQREAMCRLSQPSARNQAR